MEKYVICLRLCGENVVNLITRVVSMEIVWRQCEEILLLKFYGKISQEIVWRFYGKNMVDQITRQSPY